MQVTLNTEDFLKWVKDNSKVNIEIIGTDTKEYWITYESIMEPVVMYPSHKDKRWKK